MACDASSSRCIYWNAPDYLRPACCTHALRTLLEFSAALLARHRIFHWLDYGALLGAVRSGELVPWDSDVDWGIFREDLPRLRALESEIAAAAHELDTRDPEIWRINFSAANTQHVDLFPHYRENGLVKLRYGSAPPERWGFEERFLDQLENVSLYGREYPAPSPVSEFLALRYGPDWKTPRRE
jgi:hypothetical protein